MIAEQSDQDPVMKKTRSMIEEGLPNISQIPKDMKEMYHVRASLNIADDMMIYGNRLVIPTKIRKKKC